MKVSHIRSIINSIPLDHDEHEFFISENNLAPTITKMALSSGNSYVNKRADWNKFFSPEDLSEEDALNWNLSGPAYLLEIE